MRVDIKGKGTSPQDGPPCGCRPQPRGALVTQARDQLATNVRVPVTSSWLVTHPNSSGPGKCCAYGGDFTIKGTNQNQPQEEVHKEGHWDSPVPRTCQPLGTWLCSYQSEALTQAPTSSCVGSLCGPDQQDSTSSPWPAG